MIVPVARESPNGTPSGYRGAVLYPRLGVSLLVSICLSCALVGELHVCAEVDVLRRKFPGADKRLCVIFTVLAEGGLFHLWEYLEM